MKKALPHFLCSLLFVAMCGCGSSDAADSDDSEESTTSTSFNSSEDTDNEDDTETYVSGDANVHYSNPNTGTQSDYDLDVDYDSNGEVERINFNNGGWIDDTHISDQTNNGDGTITVTTDRGYEYTVDESPDASSPEESEVAETDSYDE